MNETKNKTTNCIISSNILNICPSCGHPAYEVETQYAMYHIGCIHCGFRGGLSASVLPYDGFNDEVKTRMRKQWNKRCIDGYYTEEAREELNIFNCEYLMIDSDTFQIVASVPDLYGVREYILKNPHMSFIVRYNNNGTLINVGLTTYIRDMEELQQIPIWYEHNKG